MQPSAKHEGPHETLALRREVSQESRACTCADALEGCHQFRLIHMFSIKLLTSVAMRSSYTVVPQFPSSYTCNAS